MMTEPQFNLLRRLSAQLMSCIELAPEVTSRKVDLGKAPGVKLVQTLTKLGYARDYGSQWGRRVEIRLRIWGITDAGKAVLQQQSLAENKNESKTGGQNQMALTLMPKPVPSLAPRIGPTGVWVKPVTTSQLAEFGRRRKATAPKAQSDRPTISSTKKGGQASLPLMNGKAKEKEDTGKKPDV